MAAIKDPSFPLYVQDFLIGTAHMTLEEKGAYITLLCYQWEVGKIPEERVGNYLGIEYEKIWPQISMKFEQKKGYIFNQKLEEVREKRISFREKQVRNGSKGGRPKQKTSVKPSLSNGLTQSIPSEKPKESLLENENEYSFSLPSIVKYYNLKASTCKLRRIVKLTEQRKKSIKARVEEYGWPLVQKVIDLAAASQFMNGENDRGWTADLEWICKPSNFVKILEGKYVTSKKAPKGSSRTKTADKDTDHTVSA